MSVALASLSQAHAQAISTATGPGSYVAIGGGVSGFQTDYGRNHMEGAFAYADVNPQWRVGLEGEARYLRWHANQQVKETTYVGGVRLVLWPTSSRWEPYGKFLAGAGEITLPYGYAHGTFLTYAPGAGLNLALNERIILRIIDLEYQHWPQFTYGSLSPYGISAGLSLRLNGMSRLPKEARARH